MPCYFPQHGYKAVNGGFTKSPKKGYKDLPMTVACGGCIGCRLKYSYNWAVRCVHEAQMHDDSIFLTLTYADEHLPKNHSLDKSAVPDFIARLRKEIGHNSIKYFHSGEYGDKLSRPHYHVLLFGWKPRDAVRFRRGLFPLYTSKLLERLWPFGHCPFGELSFESAAYTARYATKKITGKKAENHYKRYDPDTGEIFQLQPEYATMSNRGGIGRRWIEKYLHEVYPSDTVLIRGHLVQPPRFYDKVLEQIDPILFEKVKINRLTKFNDRPTIDADLLADMHKAQLAKFKLLMRSIEK